MKSARVLLRGGTVITMDPARTIHEPGDVLIDGDTIVAVGPHLDVEDAEVVDATGMIVMPGFVDTHRHNWQTALRGLGADFIGPDYRNCIKGSFAVVYRPEDVYLSTVMGVIECLHGGVTTVLDWAHIMNGPDFADASVDALLASGARAVFAHACPNDADSDRWWNRSVLDHPEDARRIREQRLTSDDALVTMALGTRPPHLMSPEVMEHDWRFARELGLRITTDGGLGGGQWSGIRWEPGGYEPIKALAARGLLGDDTTYVHCNNLPDEELRMIADTGGTISISPDSEMQLGFSFPATGRAVRAGVRPAISSDLVMEVGGGMFGAMRSILNAERGLLGQQAYTESRGPDQWEITAEDVLSFATVEGARTTGLTGVGSLQPGMKADIILISTSTPNMWPAFNPVSLVVQHADTGNVDSVMVDGRWVKRAGRLLNTDLRRLEEQFTTAAESLYERAGIPKRGFRPTAHDPRWAW